MNANGDLLSALAGLTHGMDFSALAYASESISKKYREDGFARNGGSLICGTDEALAYAAARMPATYGAAFSALEQTLISSGLRPETLLDAGAGTGAVMWAAAQLLKLRGITCLEREDAMMEIGAKIAANGSPEVQTAKWIKADAASCADFPHAELVVSSYMLNEMAPKDRLRTAQSLFGAASCLLLIIEPGTPAGFSVINELRGHFLSSGARIIAPCAHEGECTLDAGDWCHFSCRIARSALHKRLKGGEAPYEDEKFAYLAVSKFGRAGDGKSRILRHPQIRKGYVVLDVCSPGGTRRVSVAKSSENYKAVRKARAGDAVIL